ncbi:unnamed protein product [Orchesella dallaii]|uniref:DUF5641 domain-containing protein n=1 Tax=Orchesella dallaii TaxID=48710 RepID=A0ABP1RWR1_9HEXA
MNRLTRWQRAQQITQHFWKRWSNEYLSTLQKRFKWTTSDRDLQVGDIVLVKEDNHPPMKWKAGRVIKAHPGQDNKVRVVTVRLYNTESNKYFELKRHVNKLCPLLTNEEY